MTFPTTRMRRLRRGIGIREMLTEVRIHPSRLIYPIFVDEKVKSRHEIALMPGQWVYPLKDVGKLAESLQQDGIGAVLLFGVPAKKDAMGSQAYARGGVVQKATELIKSSSSLVVSTDLCLCEYTSNGQCGLMSGSDVDNDRTLELYARIAESQADAGSDIIAPSGMMDGQVKKIRESLDSSGHGDRMIMSYASKTASAFYGPFREAAQSAPSAGDRKGYQMNYANAREAIRELKIDLDEGADILMVKPALPNLDIVREARMRFDVPIAAYSVSGEYGMLRAAADRGMMDYKSAVVELATSIFRSGADLLVTYHARELIDWAER